MVNLIGKTVVVFANSITYRGRLVEIGETEIHLEAESGWITIPVAQVSSIREARD